jgi:hypothetical protein
LNRLGGPVEPVSDQPICAGLSPAIFFQSRSTFLTGRRSVTCPFFVALHLFLLHAVTPCLVTSLAHSVLFFSCCRSADSSVCQRHFFVRSLPWHTDFFLLAAAQRDSRTCVESGLVCMQNLFFCMQRLVTSPLPRTQFFCLFGFACRHLCLVRSLACCRSCARNFFVAYPLLCPAAVARQEQALRDGWHHAARRQVPACEWRIFYLVNSRGAHADFLLFVLSGHLFSPQRVQIFLDISALPAH